MKAHDVVRVLLRAGWLEAPGKGSHRNFRHPDRPGKVTVPFHGSRDLSIGVIRSIEKLTSLTLLPKR
ncbi:type II toxin-antitoxin system HicA family toxin [Falsiroseomonas sp.]|uniref:type II toxin-antitoxin system HicA family toxin n=1 Tax=Falsiroseomonas sp. TaxID=2870721 RepID=UPI00356738B1